jgi:hypothetical protein
MLRWRRSAHPSPFNLARHRGQSRLLVSAETFFSGRCHFLQFGTSIQGYSRVIMSPTKLKMQPTIHFRKKAGTFNFNSRLFSGNVVWVAFQFRRAHNHSRITLYTPFWFFHRRVLLPSPGKSPLCFLFYRKVSLHSSWHITRGIPLPTFVFFFSPEGVFQIYVSKRKMTVPVATLRSRSPLISIRG